jgi:hypothetical protein
MTPPRDRGAGATDAHEKPIKAAQIPLGSVKVPYGSVAGRNRSIRIAMNMHPSATKKAPHPAASPRRLHPTHHVHRNKPPADNATSAPQVAEDFGAGTAALDLYTVRIGYFQPEAHEVYLAGSFNEWDPRETPMLRDSLGDWSIELSLPPGEHRYRLVVDGEWRDDPAAQRMEANPFGGFDSIVVV